MDTERNLQPQGLLQQKLGALKGEKNTQRVKVKAQKKTRARKILRGICTRNILDGWGRVYKD